MIALRTCLRVPYAITCLAYAGDFFDMALREAYAGTFVFWNVLKWHGGTGSPIIVPGTRW